MALPAWLQSSRANAISKFAPLPSWRNASPNRMSTMWQNRTGCRRSTSTTTIPAAQNPDCIWNEVTQDDNDSEHEVEVLKIEREGTSPVLRPQTSSSVKRKASDVADESGQGVKRKPMADDSRIWKTVNGNGSLSAPFLVDSDSDDEVDTELSHNASSQSYTDVACHRPGAEPLIDATKKESQRRESRMLRQEAVQRKSKGYSPGDPQHSSVSQTSEEESESSCSSSDSTSTEFSSAGVTNTSRSRSLDSLSAEHSDTVAGNGRPPARRSRSREADAQKKDALVVRAQDRKVGEKEAWEDIGKFEERRYTEARYAGVQTTRHNTLSDQRGPLRATTVQETNLHSTPESPSASRAPATALRSQGSRTYLASDIRSFAPGKPIPRTLQDESARNVQNQQRRRQDATDTDRERRILAMKARNERNREGEAAVKSESPSPSDLLTDTSRTFKTSRNQHANTSRLKVEHERAPSGGSAWSAIESDTNAGLHEPHSLSIPTGQALLASRDANIGDPVTVNVDYKKRAHYKGKLNAILPADITVHNWRHEGMCWNEVAWRYHQAYGRKLTASTISNRHNRVRRAIEYAGVDGNLINSVMKDELGALDALNKIVLESEVKLDAEQAKRIQAYNPATSRRIKREDVDRIPSRTIDEWNRILANGGHGVRVASTSTDQAEGHRRDGHPQTGGKFLTPTAMQHYLENVAEAYAEAAIEESEAEEVREQFPLTEEDFCHFIYQVQQRFINQQDIGDDGCIDQVPWMLAEKMFDSLVEANKAAAAQSLMIPADWGDGSLGFNLDTNYDDNGHVFCKCTWPEKGISQTTVTQQLRHHRDGVLPRHDVSLAPRTIYLVVVETRTKSGDDVFEQSTESATMELAEKKVYTTLELANNAAVKEYVRRTFKPTTIHLTKRDQQIQEEVRRLTVDLDSDDGEMFSKSAESEAGKSVVRVLVEQARLCGPRNF